MAWLDDLTRDVQFAWRTLRRAPGFTIIAVGSLALATGASTVIFSVVYGVLLKPLPFAHPDRLVQVYGRNWSQDQGGVPDSLTGPVGSPELASYQTQSRLFDGFATYALGTKHLDGLAGIERLTSVSADETFFSTLGAEAMIGRAFRAGDPPDVAVISAGLWRRRFGEDRTLPGKTITLDGRASTILGVMPDAFQFPYGAASMLNTSLPQGRTDVWVLSAPLRDANGALRRGRNNVIARLASGATLAIAESELRVIAAGVEAVEYRGRNTRVGVRLEPLSEVVVGPIERSLWMLFAAAGLVLAAACANVANLMLARMTVRAREVVTRAALGAGRLRLVRQFLVESLMIALAGGAVGAIIARWGTPVLLTIGAARIPRAHDVALDWTVFAFLFLVSVSTAVFFGLAPAVTAARADIQAVTKSSGGPATMGRTYGRIRDGLVVVEVALAFVLALGGALVMLELHRLQHVRTGMTTDGVLVLHLTPNAPARTYYEIEASVSQLPGVEGAGLTQLVPLQNWGWEANFSIKGRPNDSSAPRQVAGLRYVTPGYFRALGIPVLRGRGFTYGDTETAVKVILINDALARRYFPGQDPVGTELDRGVIVGVVGDVLQVGLDKPAAPELYYPAAQNVTMAPDIGMSLVVRAGASGAGALPDAIRTAVRDINRNLAIFNVRTMDQVLADSLWEVNLYRWLIGLFAALALALAAVGLYGVLSYSVTSRLREFALRLALGSDPGALSRLILGRALRLALAGLAAGLALVLAVAPIARTLPVGPGMGVTAYLGVAALLILVALAACVVPAIRVARVNPAQALRYD
jgi:predicted permease